MDFQGLRKRIEGTSLASLQEFLEEDFLGQITHGDFRRWRRSLANLPDIEAKAFSGDDVVMVGAAQELDADSRSRLEQQLREFIPWRKGPFSVFGIEIDSEWRSQLKWNRLQDAVSPLAGRTVLDVGSGNGYYGFRMAAAGAGLVVGIDQHIPYVAQFWALKHFLPELPVFVLPVSTERLPAALESFDTAFSMGVIYHARSPLDHLLQLRDALRPGGELVLETLYVDGPEGYSLTPVSRYARMPNVWFVPSIPTLNSWLRRCEFEDIRVVSDSKTDSDEQRKTEWMPYDSFADSLDPQDPSRTIEGLPAPKRVVIIAKRP